MWEYNHTNELYHYGIKGMKWGVRRYQNKDGTYTSAGKKRRSQDPETIQKRKDTAKKVGVGLAAVGTVAAATALYGKNRDTVNDMVKAVGFITIGTAKTAREKTINTGKKCAKEALFSAKEGVKEGIKEAPKKAAKAVVTGVTMMATKRALDAAVGKAEAARIFQANEKKKISSFWKVNDQRDKDDEDDD